MLLFLTDTASFWTRRLRSEEDVWTMSPLSVQGLDDSSFAAGHVRRHEWHLTRFRRQTAMRTSTGQRAEVTRNTSI